MGAKNNSRKLKSDHDRKIRTVDPLMELINREFLTNLEISEN